MHHKIFTALPDFVSKLAKDLLFESQLNEQTGLIAWPRVMKYEYYTEFNEKISTPNPPLTEDKYNVRIFNIEAYEYLTKTGWVHDPKHTGRPISEVIDNRAAPGA